MTHPAASIPRYPNAHKSDEMTRFIYALKEIRTCLEAELLTDVQQRLALLSQDMDNHNGHGVLHQPTYPRG